MSHDAWTPVSEQLILLRRNLTDYFSDHELRALCSKLGVNYEHLRGQGKAARASELVRYLAARGRIPELVALASQLRPDVSWGDTPGDLAARTGPSLEPSTSSKRIGMTLGLLAVMLIVVTGLALVLSGGLRVAQPGVTPSLALRTPSPAPTTGAPTVLTSTPTTVAVTATPLRTPAPPTETFAPPTETLIPPMATETAKPAPTGTATSPASARSSAPRVVTLQAPPNGACTKSPVITFKWAGATLRPGESFLLLITPYEVNTGGKCTHNYTSGVQYSPLLRSYEWTTDISAPPQVPAACAGIVDWTVYISGAAGRVTQVSPSQSYEWNPLKCKSPVP